MGIKNKDGSLFKLQGINPLMKEQEHWEKDDWQIHYVEKEEVVIQDPKRIIPEGVPEDASIPSIKGVGFVQQTEIIYCLPLITTTIEDPLYGQTKKITSWGEKFNFEAIRTNCTGISAVFFARLPDDVVKIIERGSIIYVFKEREWWEVSGIEPNNDGISIYCMPSKTKPSFT